MSLVPDEVHVSQDLLSWTIDRTPDTIPMYLREYLLAEEMSFRQDDYIPIYPINLMEHFDATIRKYDINIKLEEDSLKTNEDDCGICLELTKDSDNMHLNCGHKFCGQCIKGCLNAGKPSCAMCRCPIKNITVKKQELYELVSEYCN